MRFNEYPIDEYLIYEDSGKPDCNEDVKAEFPFLKFIEPPHRTGQIIAQDTLWQNVKSEYALAWEEDWETVRGGFVEKAIPILRGRPNILQVIFRSPLENNGHPTTLGGIGYRTLSTHYKWKGFSFAPSLKRKSDYNKIGTYQRHAPFNRQLPAQSEYKLGVLYWRLGYKAAILNDGYVKHIGAGMHVH